jgi:hypothetical protein
MTNGTAAVAYRVIVIDISPLTSGRGRRPRFVLEFEATDDSWAKNWRQRPPFDRRYWQTAAGGWYTMDRGNGWPDRVYFAGAESGAARQNPSLVFHSFSVGSYDTFPQLGQRGLGFLFEAHDNQDPLLMPNVYWQVVGGDVPDPRQIWIGGGGKYGGHAVVYRREAMHGWIFNCANFSKRAYIQIETNSLGVGLGASAGAVFIFAIAPTAEALLGVESTGFDFNLSFAGKIDDTIKAISNGRTYMKVAELGKFAIEVYNRAGIITKGAFEEYANAAKTICTGLGMDSSSPGVTVFDVPKGGVGLEVGFVHNWSKVTDVEPF